MADTDVDMTDTYEIRPPRFPKLDPGGNRLIATQPLLPATDLRRQAVHRRQNAQPNTQPVDPADRQSSNPTVLTQVQLRSDVFDHIYKRMEEAEVPMASVDMDLIHFLLPTSKEHITSWQHLMASPMLVTDAELKSMFALRKCTSLTPAPAADQVIFYVRSYAYEVQELDAVIKYLESSGVILPKAAAWRKIMEGLSPTAVVFLRYAGQTVKSAYARHYDDMTAVRSNHATHIVQATRLLYPEIVDEMNVFEFLKGTIPLYIKGANFVRDLRERATIGLFDISTLLNIQSGGMFVDPNHSPAVEKLFSSLAVRPLTFFVRHTVPCGQTVIDGLATYVETVQQYANENPRTTGTYAASFTDGYRSSMLKQITPVTITKTPYAPMVMIGHDPTIQMFQSGTSIWQSDSFVNLLLTTTIDMFGREEGVNSGTTRQLAQSNRIPFIDLFPWCKKAHRDLEVVMDRMRFYLQTTNPVVVVTFGEHVSSVARGNFLHAHGLKSGTLASHVGQMVIRNYSDPDAPDAEKCVIVIPCHHPGSISYGSVRTKDAVDVFVLTMIIAWTATYYGMKYGEEAARGNHSKKVFLEYVIKKTTAKVGKETVFADTFKEAREKLKESLHRSLVGPKSHVPFDPNKPRGRGSVQPNIRDADRSWGQTVERRPFDQLKLELGVLQEGNTESDVQQRAATWENAKPEVEMIMQCGWAMHPPHSVEANLQARALVSKHYATMYTNKTGTTMTEVRSWAEAIDQNKFYYFEATDDNDHKVNIPNLLTIFASEETATGAGADWNKDPQLLLKSSKKVKEWFGQKVLQNSTTPATATVRGFQSLASLMYKKDPDLAVVQRALMGQDLKDAPRVHDDPNASLEGVQVDVIAWRNDKTSAALVLSWVDDSGRQWDLTGHSRDKSELCLPPICMTTSQKDTRHIHFVRDGIDIRTKSGQSLKADGTSCTVPLSQIRLMLQGGVQKAFINLWEKETRLNPDEAEEIDDKEQNASELSGPFYPATEFQPGPGCRKNRKLDVGSRGATISEKKQIENIKDYLPLQAGDELWLLHKFLQEQYPNAGRVDACNPKNFPNADSLWARLLAFCDKPMYQHHPMRQHLRDIASLALEDRNTAGCETMLKLAIEQFLRPGSSRERKQIWFKDIKKKKWGIWFDLSANRPSPRTLPPSVRPRLDHNEIIQTVSGDAVELDDEDDVEVLPSDVVDDSVNMYAQEANEARSRALARVRVPKRAASKSPSPARETFSSSVVRDSQSPTGRNVAQGDPVEPEWDEMLLDRYG